MGKSSKRNDDEDSHGSGSDDGGRSRRHEVRRPGDKEHKKKDKDKDKDKKDKKDKKKESRDDDSGNEHSSKRYVADRFTGTTYPGAYVHPAATGRTESTTGAAAAYYQPYGSEPSAGVRPAHPAFGYAQPAGYSSYAHSSPAPYQSPPTQSYPPPQSSAQQAYGAPPYGSSQYVSPQFGSAQYAGQQYGEYQAPVPYGSQTAYGTQPPPPVPGGYTSPSQCRTGSGHYPPPPGAPSALEQAYAPYMSQQPLPQQSYPPPMPNYQAPPTSVDFSANYPAPAHTKPKKYAPKHHSTAQETTLAALKPEQKPNAVFDSAASQPPTVEGATSSGGGGRILDFMKKRTSNKPTDVLSSFAGSLLPSLHDYARTLFPASTTHSNPYFSSAASSPANPDLRTGHRFDSFAPMRTSIRHHPKWYVDGKDYMWAVSCALENAKHTIWIMDWWLSPELHLRRPASKWTFPGDPPGGRYRLDNMLAAAAARGVEVKIIVYKEVEAALTLNSHYTKKALEARHPNIAVMRHPDHVPDATNTVSDIYKEMKDGYKLGDFLRGLYGMKDGKVLFWAHHEKMVLVDAGWGEGQEKGFMGGLDLCFGRWDTNEHPLADVREDVESEIFLGQDYNNARVMDFHTVEIWSQNKLDRTKSSRMGWSDVALSIQGPILKDMARHFIQRWNFIYDEKYRIRFTGGERYKKLPELSDAGHPMVKKKLHGIKENVKVKVGNYSHAGYGGYGDHGQHGQEPSQYQYHGAVDPYSQYGDGDDEGLGDRDGVRCQLLRSASKWSHGTRETEHSICNAYIETILKAQHFIYIENQFFITATSPEQSPILNLIGAAIVERIMRAYTSGQRFKIIIVIPAVPGFAGDLQDDGSLGTRAIMEFQYRSIIRDRGYSIIEQLEKKGIPRDMIWSYIRFFNLRNYDRINYTSRVEKAEKEGGVAFDQARQDYEKRETGVGYGPYSSGRGNEHARYAAHQSKAPSMADRWASVARCAMLGGDDIREIPWYGAPEKEIEAFVSEELYIHSKLLIADDRTVICGSANLNDRSQLGDHDSEIAIIIEDPTPLPSMMAGHHYVASHFAATLRRQIFRKHLGLIPAQDLDDIRDENMQPSPVPNVYDFDSEEDRLVADPLSEEFTNLWDQIARTNTECFRRVFRPVPDDTIRNWKQYDEWWGSVFTVPKSSKIEVKKSCGGGGGVPPGKEGEKQEAPPEPQAEEMWGHVVRRNFSPDPVQAAREVKQVLAHIRGHLVECPLYFLEEEDIAKEGVGLNAFTETVYT